MNSFDVPCANIDCDSEDITRISSTEIGNEVKHHFRCDFCKTEYDIYTRLENIKIPKN